MLLCTIKTMGSPAWNEGNPSAPGPGSRCLQQRRCNRGARCWNQKPPGKRRKFGDLPRKSMGNSWIFMDFLGKPWKNLMFSPKKGNSATTCKGFIVQQMDFNQKTKGVFEQPNVEVQPRREGWLLGFSQLLLLNFSRKIICLNKHQTTPKVTTLKVKIESKIVLN